MNFIKNKAEFYTTRNTGIGKQKYESPQDTNIFPKSIEYLTCLDSHGRPWGATKPSTL